MKKLIALLMLLIVAFVIFNRYRVYVRDPLATVTRAGIKEDGAQVFINYANDVLIENDHAPVYIELVQHGQNAGAPVKISCIHWAACLLDENVATLIPYSPPVQVEVMNGKLVQFKDGKGETDVALR